MADAAPTPYPKRPRFFSHRFTRLMAKVCLANDIGPEACWMLTVIAHTEDAGGYRKAVTYFNHQLAPVAGVGSVDALDRIRKKAVASGWLHYEPGKKGVAGRYFVVIPDNANGIDDEPTDESYDEFLSAESRKQAGGKPEESAEHSSLSLPLSLSLPQETPAAPALPFESAEFRTAWEEWEQHLKEKRKPLKATARKAQFRKVAKMGEARAIAAIENSISGNYQGIFEPSVNGNGKPQAVGESLAARLQKRLDEKKP